MTNYFVDAHLHLQDKRICTDIAYHLRVADKAGVKLLICNAAKEGDWQQVLSLAANHLSIKAYLGIHPWFSDETSEHWDENLLELVTKHGTGIGEIGLDGIVKKDKKRQEEVFRLQLEIACHTGKPATIHCLKQWSRMLDILNSYKQDSLKFIIHSFSGSRETMKQLLDFGGMLSFSTQLANPARQKLREVFIKTPIDRLLLETDSPDQFCPSLTADLPKSTINTPAMIAPLYAFAARLRGVDLDELTNVLWENGKIFTN